MSASRLDQLENAVDRLLQRNAQLRDLCERLLGEQESWGEERRELLAEVEDLLGRLEGLRERQA